MVGSRALKQGCVVCTLHMWCRCVSHLVVGGVGGDTPPVHTSRAMEAGSCPLIGCPSPPPLAL